MGRKSLPSSPFSSLRKMRRAGLNRPFWSILFLHCTRSALLGYCLGGRPSTLLPSLWDSCDLELHQSNP